MIVDSLAFDFGQDKADREAERRDREAELREREREREAQWYSEGQDAADEYRWDRAIELFNRVVELKGSKVDAALYWKAYAQNRLGPARRGAGDHRGAVQGLSEQPLSQSRRRCSKPRSSATSASRSARRTRPTTRSS